MEDEEEPEERERRRKEKKKRRREEREEEEAGLDEEDLDLIGEAIPGFERRAPSEVRGSHPLAKLFKLTSLTAEAEAIKAWAQGGK